MSLFASNDSSNFRYTWLQRCVGNIIHYGCTSRPRHIAIVIDGNRRFAREQNFNRAQSHLLGSDKLFGVCAWCHDFGIYELSAYALSLENLKRSQNEIDAIMEIICFQMKEIENKGEFHKRQIRIRIIGNTDLFSDDLREVSYRLMNSTRNYKKFILNVYLYYTSRDEIKNTIKNLAVGCEKDLIHIDDINDDLIMQSLMVSTNQTGSLPDIFLRTAGEQCLSDFMLLQCRFTMWIFVNTCWSAFNVWDFYWILLQYEIKSKTLINLQNQCQNIVKQHKTNDEQRNERIKTYLNWLEQQRIEQLKEKSA
jgi:undecaprenyl diphosphate synthase